jgi:hypothetical protein
MVLTFTGTLGNVVLGFGFRAGLGTAFDAFFVTLALGCALATAAGTEPAKSDTARAPETSIAQRRIDFELI